MLDRTSLTLRWGMLLLASLSLHSQGAQGELDPRPLTLDMAIRHAIEHDPWLQGNTFRQQALQAQSVSASTSPDPVVSVGLLNLPSNGFAFDQEPMTQFKVGVAQSFPRGDSLELERQQLSELASGQPHQRADRRAKITLTVAQLWLEILAAQQSIELIGQERGLFEQLAQTVETQYASAQGMTRQDDVVRAQLETTQLDDRLTLLESKRDMALAKLDQWLQNLDLVSYSDLNLSVHQDLLLIDDPANRVSKLLSLTQRQKLDMLSQHPVILATQAKINASQKGVELAEQKYQPQWGVNASYAYRADDQQDRSRADFFSVGVSFDVPLFTSNKQDKDVQAAKFNSQSMETDKRLMLREMLAQLNAQLSQYQRMTQRLALYTESILPQLHEQAEASLTAYTNNDGDFTEVMRARIAEFNGKMAHIDILAQQQGALLQMQYYATDFQLVNQPGAAQ